MISRDDVLRVLGSKGPSVPTDFTSELKENSFIIGAILSELVSSKKVLLSHAKFGGSPLYYLPTQQSGLVKLYPHLNEKDKRAFDILKRDQILYDEPQTPLMKAALRNLKDFAIPFKVTYKGKQFLYWRWYLCADDVIKEKVNASLKELFPEPVVVVKEDSLKESFVAKEKSLSLEPTKENAPLKENSNSQASTPKEHVSSSKKTMPDNSKESHIVKKDTSETVSLSSYTNISTVDDEFSLQVKAFLNSLSIKILHQEILVKKREVNFIIQIPAPIGNITYFCKARNKKKSSEGDISTAYVEGQLKGLPVVYISTGDIPKKVQDILPDKYKNLKVLKI